MLSYPSQGNTSTRAQKLTTQHGLGEECGGIRPCANENWHGHNFDLIVTIKVFQIQAQVSLST